MHLQRWNTRTVVSGGVKYVADVDDCVYVNTSYVVHVDVKDGAAVHGNAVAHAASVEDEYVNLRVQM